MSFYFRCIRQHEHKSTIATKIFLNSVNLGLVIVCYPFRFNYLIALDKGRDGQRVKSLI